MRRGAHVSLALLAVAVLVAAIRPAVSAADHFRARGPILASGDGRALFTGRPFAPGETRSRCITVTNRGAGQGPVRLYGQTSGSGLDRYLVMSVVRGTLTGTSRSCRGFHAARPVFRGSLRQFPDTYRGGIRLGAWAPRETHVFRFTVRLRNDPAAQGLAAGQSFLWQSA